jgi:hypothetical protein
MCLNEIECTGAVSQSRIFLLHPEATDSKRKTAEPTRSRFLPSPSSRLFLSFFAHLAPAHRPRAAPPLLVARVAPPALLRPSTAPARRPSSAPWAPPACWRGGAPLLAVVGAGDARRGPVRGRGARAAACRRWMRPPGSRCWRGSASVWTVSSSSTSHLLLSDHRSRAAGVEEEPCGWASRLDGVERFGSYSINQT